MTTVKGLQRCQESLKKWTKKGPNNLRGSILSKLEEFAQIQKSNLSQYSAGIKQIQNEVDNRLEEENIIWKQRAKQR